MRRKAGVQENLFYNKYASTLFAQRLHLLVTSMFEWSNLPNNIPSRFIEEILYNEGKIAFYCDEELGFLVAKCNEANSYNIYDETTLYTLIANNGYNKLVDSDKLIIIRNNSLNIPSDFFTTYYVKKLYEIDRTIDVNIMQQKTPTLIQCSENQRLTLQNLFTQYEGNIPFIYGSKELNMEGVKTFPLNAPYVADKLQQQKCDTWREILDIFGINNANVSKRERLITDEVNSNNQLLMLSSESFLQERQKAVEQINIKFNLNIEVKRKEFLNLNNEEMEENIVNE